MTEIHVAVAKRKVGPLTARYHNGAFRDVETENDGVRRVALCGLDNSHNGDYKVAYASDPLLVVHAQQPGHTHDELKTKLKNTGLWLEEMEPIEIPTHPDRWLAGFKTLPRSKNRLGLFKSRLEKVKVKDSPLLERDNSVTAWV